MYAKAVECNGYYIASYNLFHVDSLYRSTGILVTGRGRLVVVVNMHVVDTLPQVDRLHSWVNKTSYPAWVCCCVDWV